MKKKATRPKLVLRRETLEKIAERRLSPVAGGESGGACTVYTSCSPGCCPDMTLR